MLIDTSVTIAYKCSSCGSFEFFNISLFTMLMKKEYSFACRCHKSGLTVRTDNGRSYRISTPCIGCGSTHVFMFNRKDFIYKDLNVFSCPVTGVQQCFIGNDEKVRRKIDCLEKEFDELINLFGYDDYFKNTQVMFDALNRVHDIAEEGNLFCECGNDDVELILLSDRIHLKCKKCSASRDILAASNKDLKEILLKQQILLLGDSTGYDIRNSRSYLGNNDGR